MSRVKFEIELLTPAQRRTFSKVKGATQYPLTLARTYTNRDQLATINAGTTTIDTRTYDDGGRMLTSAYNNGVSETRAYNTDNTLSSINYTGAPVGDLTYGWDDNKNKTSESITGTMSGYGFDVGATGYDDEDRLVNWNRSDNNLDQAWNLSLVGDWNSITENTSTQNRTHGPTHEMLTAAGQAATHDTKGNMTSIPAVLRPGSNPLSMNWDADNRLTSADIDNDSTADVSYKFDALGRGVFRDDGTTATIFVQSGQQTIADYTAGTAATTPIYTYVYASYIDEPVMRGGTGGLRYYHRGQQFSINVLTNGGGSVVERYAYCAYGTPAITDSAGTVQTVSSEGNRYLYTGREWDEGLSLYYYRARMYHAVSGRFCGRDPIGYREGWALYRHYLGMSRTDPSGLLSADPISSNPGCGSFEVNWKVRGDGILVVGVVVQGICFSLSVTRCDIERKDCLIECVARKAKTGRVCYLERLINNEDGQSNTDRWSPPSFRSGSCGSKGTVAISAEIRTFMASDLSDVPFSGGDTLHDVGPWNIRGRDTMPFSGDGPDWWKHKHVSSMKSFAYAAWNCCGTETSSSLEMGTIRPDEFLGDSWEDDGSNYDPRGPRHPKKVKPRS